MKLCIQLALLLMSGLLLTGCSTIEDFAVLNRSRDTIEVRYTSKGCSSQASATAIDKLWPAELTIPEFEQSRHEWNSLSEHEVQQDRCTLEASVRPNEALRVDSTFNYRGHDSEASHLKFNIDELRITGRTGTMSFRGRQAQTAFKENDSGDYVLEYH